MITINQAIKVVDKALEEFENIDLYKVSSIPARLANQRQIHRGCKVLLDFKDELIREKIKNKQKRNKEEEGTNDR